MSLLLDAGRLACLPDMTPARLSALLDELGDPGTAYAAVEQQPARVAAALARCHRGGPADMLGLARRWSHAVAVTDHGALLTARGTQVYVAGTEGYPIVDDIPDRPSVLLAEGDRADALRRPLVAVVGTRSASPHGLADAHEVGEHLARAGVTVVSGLAIGIDGAAHLGALDGGGTAIGVVATGLDVVYPRRHVALFDRVRHSGLLVSETGFGVRPHPARFPVRNRIIAALADVVVVVEATLTGGARITAERAIDYGRPVLAMPGSRRNPAAAGCNALIADGAQPLLEPDDVLLALNLTPGSRRAQARPRPGGHAGAVLAACGGEPATADQLASRTGLPPEQVASALRDLAQRSLVERSGGMWWPR